VIGLIIFSVCGLFYAYTASVSDLLIVRLIQGIGGGFVFPISMAYMGDLAPKDKEGLYMGIFHVAVLGGVGLGPVFGGLLNDNFGMTTAFYAFAAISALATFIAIFFLPESENLAIIDEGTSLLSGFKDVISSGKMQGLLILRFGVMLAVVPSFIFLPILMTSAFNSSGTEIGIVITFRVLIGALLQLPCGWLADRYSKIFLSSFPMFFMAGFLSVMGLAESPLQVGIIFCLIGAGEAVFMPASSAIALENGRGKGMGVTMGVMNTAMNLGMFVGSILAGIMLDNVGLSLTFIILGVLVVISALGGLPILIKNRDGQRDVFDLKFN
jgi:MFS family permease